MNDNSLITYSDDKLLITTENTVFNSDVFPNYRGKATPRQFSNVCEAIGNGEDLQTVLVENSMSYSVFKGLCVKFTDCEMYYQMALKASSMVSLAKVDNVYNDPDANIPSFLKTTYEEKDEDGEVTKSETRIDGKAAVAFLKNKADHFTKRAGIADERLQAKNAGLSVNILNNYQNKNRDVEDEDSGNLWDKPLTQIAINYRK